MYYYFDQQTAILHISNNQENLNFRLWTDKSCKNWSTAYGCRVYGGSIELPQNCELMFSIEINNKSIILKAPNFSAGTQLPQDGEQGDIFLLYD